MGERVSLQITHRTGSAPQPLTTSHRGEALLAFSPPVPERSTLHVTALRMLNMSAPQAAGVNWPIWWRPLTRPWGPFTLLVGTIRSTGHYLAANGFPQTSSDIISMRCACVPPSPQPNERFSMARQALAVLSPPSPPLYTLVSRCLVCMV